MVQQAADELDAVFSALSDPTRRAIVQRLAAGEATVSQLSEPFAMTLTAVAKHLQVLSDAGLVEHRKEGRVRHCRLTAGPLREVHAWVGEYGRFWEGQLDSLAAHVSGPARDRRACWRSCRTGSRSCGRFTGSALTSSMPGSPGPAAVVVGPPGITVSGLDGELRVGGCYRIAMDVPGGERRVLIWAFHEIARPSRLVYSWRWEGGPDAGAESTVTVKFRDAGGGTEVEVIHTDITDRQIRDSHAQGWLGCLDSLQAAL